MPERREGFLYINSESLKQEIAMSKKTGWLYTQDKYPDGSLVSYSPSELEVLAKSGCVLSMCIHTVKKILGGTIIECDIQEGNVKENIPEIRQGEFDIY